MLVFVVFFFVMLSCHVNVHCLQTRLKNTFWHAALWISLVYFSRLIQEFWSLVSENHCCVYFPNPFPSLKIVSV